MGLFPAQVLSSAASKERNGCLWVEQRTQATRAAEGLAGSGWHYQPLYGLGVMCRYCVAKTSKQTTERTSVRQQQAPECKLTSNEHRSKPQSGEHRLALVNMSDLDGRGQSRGLVPGWIWCGRRQQAVAGSSPLHCLCHPRRSTVRSPSFVCQVQPMYPTGNLQRHSSWLSGVVTAARTRAADSERKLTRKFTERSIHGFQLRAAMSAAVTRAACDHRLNDRVWLQHTPWFCNAQRRGLPVSAASQARGTSVVQAQAGKVVQLLRAPMSATALTPCRQT